MANGLTVRSTDLMLVAAGLALLLVGLYRIVPVKIFSTASLLQWVPVWTMFLIAFGAMALTKGDAGLKAGFGATLNTTANFLPTIVGFFAVMGFGAVLAKYFNSEIVTGLQGKTGFLCAFLSAFAVPSSTTVAPQIQSLWNGNPETRGAVLFFFITSPLLSFTILIIRQMGLGWAISLKMYGASVVISILSGVLIWFASPLLRFL